MKIKGTPDLEEALFRVLKYVLTIIIPGEHWLPRNMRKALVITAYIIVFLVGLILAYAKLTRHL